MGHKEAVRKLPDDGGAARLVGRLPGADVPDQQNLYATQFHPELDVAGIEQRIRVYRDYGYFPPEEARAGARAVRSP